MNISDIEWGHMYVCRMGEALVTAKAVTLSESHQTVAMIVKFDPDAAIWSVSPYFFAPEQILCEVGMMDDADAE